MAIQIKKEQQQRNTPLGRFIAVALIPLLLSYMAGFALGSAKNEQIETDDKQRINLETENSKLQKKYDDLVLRDSLSNVFALELMELQKELSSEVSGLMNAPAALIDWSESSKNSPIKSYRGKAETLLDKYLKSEVVNETWSEKMKNTALLFDRSCDIWNNRLSDKQVVAKQLVDITDKDVPKKEVNLEAMTLENQLQIVQNNLTKCETDKAALSNSLETITTKNNDTKNNILGELTTAIVKLDNLKLGLKVKKFNDEKSEIKTALLKIQTEASNIK